MNFKSVAAAIIAIGSIATCTTELIKNYDIEVHISRVWSVDEPLPERLR